jgi:fatty acid amide hydrolase
MCIKRALNEAAAALQSLGHRIVKVDINIGEISTNFYDIFSASDFWNEVEAMKGSEPWPPAAQEVADISNFPNIVKKLMLVGMRISGSGKMADVLTNFGVKSSYDLMAILAKRTELIRKVIGQLQALGAEAILMPAAITPAPIIGKGDGSELANIHVFAASHLAFPTGVVPVTVVREDEQTYEATKGDIVAKAIAEAVAGSAGLPVGVQVSAMPFRDELCLRLMREMEEVIAFKCKPLG